MTKTPPKQKGHEIRFSNLPLFLPLQREKFMNTQTLTPKNGALKRQGDAPNHTQPTEVGKLPKTYDLGSISVLKLPFVLPKRLG